MLKQLKLLMISSCMLTNVYAELPPAYYDELKQTSPEAIVIAVDQVGKTPISSDSEQITAIAKVVSVEKSRCGLKGGERIVISYDRIIQHEMGWVGPSDVPELLIKHQYKSYLESLGSSCQAFIPSARGQSFYRLSEK